MCMYGMCNAEGGSHSSSSIGLACLERGRVCVCV
jgi:hypothetical protein